MTRLIVENEFIGDPYLNFIDCIRSKYSDRVYDSFPSTVYFELMNVNREGTANG